MKLIPVSAFLFAALAFCHAGGAAAANVVEVRNVARANGQVPVALCDEATFLKNCTRRVSAPAIHGIVRVIIPNVPPGRFAVMPAPTGRR